MKAKKNEKLLARKLRIKGYSYNEIRKKVCVSKSTINKWCKDIRLGDKQKLRLRNNSLTELEKGRDKIKLMKKDRLISQMAGVGITKLSVQDLYLKNKYAVPQIASLFNVSRDRIYNFMKLNNIPRRNNKEVSDLAYKYKPKFVLKEELTEDEEKLKVAATMLYWAEGAKDSDGIVFTNSDPRMIKVFLNFLRIICGVSESRLRVHLYLYSGQNIQKIRNYWQKITNISFLQFNKPYIREVFSIKNEHKLPYGLIQIRYNDKKLLNIIKMWLDCYLKEHNWAGGGVDNRTRL